MPDPALETPHQNHQDVNPRVERYHRFLVTCASKLIRPEDLAEFRSRFSPSDVVSEAWIKTHKKQEQIKDQSEDEERAYLYTVLRNQLREMIRGAKAKQRDPARELSIDQNLTASGAPTAERLSGREIDPAEEIARRERQARVDAALDNLPDDELMVIILTEYREMKQQEIADLLGRTIGEVAKLHASALKHLRNLLKDLKGDLQ